MTAIQQTALALVLLLGVSCGRQGAVHWHDGNFEVYALQLDFNATMLGYNHHPGTLRLVEAEVVAAGSTAQWVFVERLDRPSGRTEFFIVPKEGMPENHSGTTEGPFSETQFRNLRAARQFPDFTWRRRQ